MISKRLLGIGCRATNRAQLDPEAATLDTLAANDGSPPADRSSRNAALLKFGRGRDHKRTASRQSSTSSPETGGMARLDTPCNDRPAAQGTNT
eukprot:2382183-Amphidinium_carterae.1